MFADITTNTYIQMEIYIIHIDALKVLCTKNIG